MTRLQAALTALLDGTGRLDELYDAADRARAELLASRTEVQDTLAEETPAIRQALIPEIASLDTCYKDYLHLIELCHSHQDDPGQGWLESAQANVAIVQDRLNFALQRLRESLLAERGPFTNPSLNRVLQSVGTEELESAVTEELDRLDILNGPGQLGQRLRAEMVPEQVAAYKALEQLLEDAPEQGQPSSAWMARAHRLGANFAACDRDFFRRRFQSGPTQFPSLNLVVHAAATVAAGKLTLSTLRWFVTDAFQSMTALREQVTEPAAEMPEGKSILASLDRILALLQEPGNFQQKERGAELLRSAESLGAALASVRSPVP